MLDSRARNIVVARLLCRDCHRVAPVGWRSSWSLQWTWCSRLCQTERGLGQRGISAVLGQEAYDRPQSEKMLSAGLRVWRQPIVPYEHCYDIVTCIEGRPVQIQSCLQDAINIHITSARKETYFGHSQTFNAKVVMFSDATSILKSQYEFAMTCKLLFLIQQLLSFTCTEPNAA